MSTNISAIFGGESKRERRERRARRAQFNTFSKELASRRKSVKDVRQLPRGVGRFALISTTPEGILTNAPLGRRKIFGN